MVWIAIVLAVFLFYKFVERPHKIIFFKIFGVCAVIGVVVLTIIEYYNRFDFKSKSADMVTVTFDSINPILDDKEKTKIVNEIFDEQLKQKNYLLDGLSNENLEIAKRFLLPKYAKIDINEELFVEELVKAFDGYYKNNPKDTPENATKMLMDDKLEIYTHELLDMRKKINGTKSALGMGYVVASRIRSLYKEQGSQLRKLLTSEELKIVEDIENESVRLNKIAIEKINDKKTKTEIKFKICNNHEKPLNLCKFSVSGFFNGRSTAFNINRETYRSDTDFTSDFIVSPKKCEFYTWTNRFEIFDRYEVKYISGQWAE